MPVGIYLPGVDGPGDNVNFTQYDEDNSFDVEHGFPEASDSEATTLNHAPHTPHTPQTAHTTPLTYSIASSPAPEQTAAEAEHEADSAMSDADEPSSSDDESAASSAPHASHSGVAASASLHHPPHAYFPNSTLDPPHYGAIPADVGDPQHPQAAFDPGSFDPEGVTPGILASRNPSLYRFLELWTTSSQTRDPRKFRRPFYPNVMSLVRSVPRPVGYSDLDGSWNDFQGINWADLHVSRKLARKYRFAAYKNFVNIPGSDECVSAHLSCLTLPRYAPRSRIGITDHL